MEEVEKQGIRLQCGCWVEWNLLRDKDLELTLERLDGLGEITRACPAHKEERNG